MAFETVQDLSTETTISLGGRNKTTGKANPTQIEGYFLGSKKTASKKARSGFAFIHVLQTAEGNVGVWGKTDLDRKITTVSPGVMVRITQNGMQSTPNGEMYKYKVEVDKSNTIEVTLPTSNNTEEALEGSTTSFDSNASFSESDEGTESSEYDESTAVRATAPKRPATAPDAARQAKVQALLGGKR